MELCKGEQGNVLATATTCRRGGLQGLREPVAEVATACEAISWWWEVATEVVVACEALLWQREVVVEAVAAWQKWYNNQGLARPHGSGRQQQQ